MLVELERPNAGNFTLDSTLTYTTTEGEQLSESLSAGYDGQPLDEYSAHYAQTSVHKTIALAILVSGMKEAANRYADDSEGAITHIEQVVLRIDQDATQLQDEKIDEEVELAQALRDLMVEGAEQGDFYGDY